MPETQVFMLQAANLGLISSDTWMARPVLTLFPATGYALERWPQPTRSRIRRLACGRATGEPPLGREPGGHVGLSG